MSVYVGFVNTVRAPRITRTGFLISMLGPRVSPLFMSDDIVVLSVLATFYLIRKDLATLFLSFR